MTLSRLSVACPLLFLFFLCSCTKKDIAGLQGPQGSQGPAGANTTLQGDIQGKVLLYDIAGNAIGDNSNASISLENTTPVLQASSQQDGSFVIPAVHAGQYNLKVEKQGFGAMRYLNFAHAGGEQPTETGFLQIGQQLSSQFDIKRFIVDTATVHNVPYVWNMTIILTHPQIITNPVLLYFSDSPGVGKSANALVLRQNFFQQNDSTISYVSWDTPLSIFAPVFATATNVYVVAAFDNGKVFTYKDENGISVYPSAGNTSNEVKIYNTLK